jgi:hypothetical protein
MQYKKLVSWQKKRAGAGNEVAAIRKTSIKAKDGTQYYYYTVFSERGDTGYFTKSKSFSIARHGERKAHALAKKTFNQRIKK